MSIFVDEGDGVEVKVHYAEDNGVIVVLDEPTDKTTTLTVKFRRPDFSISQRLVATSTVTDQNGGQSLNLMLLQNNLLYFLARSWDAKEPDTKDAEGKVVPGKPVELNATNLGKLRVEIARALVNGLVPVIGQLM